MAKICVSIDNVRIPHIVLWMTTKWGSKFFGQLGSPQALDVGDPQSAQSGHIKESRIWLFSMTNVIRAISGAGFLDRQCGANLPRSSPFYLRFQQARAGLLLSEHVKEFLP